LNFYHTRKLILEILDRVEKEDAYLNILISFYFSKNKPKSNDRALIQEITYGVIRFKKSLDWIISQFLTNQNKKLPLTVQNILRMGVYQILYLEKIPNYAIIYEAVELVKKSNYSGYSTLINAVLRNIIRKSNMIRWPDKKSEPIKYISVYYSFPERLVERWLERYGLELCLKICQASNNKPELTLRVNTLKINSLELQKILLKLKINFQQGIYLPSTSIIIKDYFDIKNSYLFKEGLFSIQDESSMLAAVFLAPDTGQTIFDMCSGPGGKTTHIAQLMYNKGKIIAFEKNKKRLKMVEEECHRLGIDIVTPVLMDSSKLSNKYLEKADKILLDAPCSGTGVIRKKPDLKWKRFDSYQLKELNQLQEALLTTAASYLKPGGELLYATCSIEKEENDQIISNFLKKNSNFALLDSSQFVQKNGIVKFDTKIKTDIQLLPGYSGNNIDGFYMVKMKKNR